MSKPEVALGAVVVVLSLHLACGSDVSGGSTTGAGAGTSLDQDCYDACIDKGVSEDECVSYCSDKSTSSGSGGDTTGSNNTTNTSGGGGDDKPDFTVEKSCIECWFDQGDAACAAELEACEVSLACLQLRDCPFTCGGKPGCIDECNAIIPSGVDTLAALVQCTACNAGPCADACSDSLYLEYCE